MIFEWNSWKILKKTSGGLPEGAPGGFKEVTPGRLPKSTLEGFFAEGTLGGLPEETSIKFREGTFKRFQGGSSRGISGRNF